MSTITTGGDLISISRGELKVVRTVVNDMCKLYVDCPDVVDELVKINRACCRANAALDAESRRTTPNTGMDTISQQYCELLHSVEQKFPNESRHQTALRYIQQAESNSRRGGVAKQHHA